MKTLQKAQRTIFFLIKSLMYSLLVASVVGGLYALVRRKGMKIQIPFIPCVLVTFLIIWLVEVIG